jgi:hypothetical protein
LLIESFDETSFPTVVSQQNQPTPGEKERSGLLEEVPESAPLIVYGYAECLKSRSQIPIAQRTVYFSHATS